VKSPAERFRDAYAEADEARVRLIGEVAALEVQRDLLWAALKSVRAAVARDDRDLALVVIDDALKAGGS
jgi:hypothetical protein